MTDLDQESFKAVVTKLRSSGKYKKGKELARILNQPVEEIVQQVVPAFVGTMLEFDRSEYFAFRAAMPYLSEDGWTAPFNSEPLWEALYFDEYRCWLTTCVDCL